MKRYIRNIAIDSIDIDGQELLNQKTALVIGAGGLGCHLLYHIASLGFKNVIIMDNDSVSISNLQRQILFNETSISKNKAIEASKTIEKYNSEIMCFPIQKMFTTLEDANSECPLEIDLIFDCSDNFETKMNISKEAQKANIPAIFASVGEFQGWVFTQFYKNETPILLENILSPHENDKNCDSLGVVSPSVAFVASIQAMEAMKYVLGQESQYDKMLDVNCLNYQVTELEF